MLTLKSGSLAKKRLGALVAALVPSIKKGDELLIVTSGAVGLGRKKLKLKTPLTLEQKQACAAVGQVELMNVYKDLLKQHRFAPAQILVSADSFSDRMTYLNLSKTIETLFSLGIIPVINENDPLSIAELKEEKGKSFGDNDKLSAIVATKINADILIILTDVEGVFEENPKLNPSAKVIRHVADVTRLTVKVSGLSDGGRGGMQTKIEAARMASLGGVTTFIASGLKPKDLQKILNDPLAVDRPGTLIEPVRTMSGRKKWIGLSSGFEGVVVINSGAEQALVEKQASLLAAGVVEVRGQFQRGQIVSVRDANGHEIARGVSNYSSVDAKKVVGLKTADLRAILGSNAPDVFIQRDNLVTLKPSRKPT